MVIQPSDPDIVQRAIEMIDAFYITNRAEAERCLSMWARRGLLSAADRETVLSRFPDKPAKSHMRPGRRDPRYPKGRS